VNDRSVFSGPPLTLDEIFAGLDGQEYEDEDGNTHVFAFDVTDREALNAALIERAKADEKREKLSLVDVGEVMRDGVPPVTLLVEGLPLVIDGAHTEFFGEKANGKTFLLLWTAARLILEGRHVVWVDKEMGVAEFARRFDSMGVPSERVSEFFHYLDHPTFAGDSDSQNYWAALLDVFKPALIVFDARTEFLASIGANENIGTDAAKWDAMYLGPARRRDIATAMIDHVGHAEKERQRGTGHKGNAAKVELLVECVKRFDKHTVGRMKVTLKKNSYDAPIPDVQHFELGGEATDTGWGFVLRPAAADAKPDTKTTWWTIAQMIIDMMIERDATSTSIDKDLDKSLSTTQVYDFVKTVAKSKVLEVLKDLALNPDSPVQSDKYGRSTKYWIDASSADDYAPMPSSTATWGGQSVRGEN
jgi:AAA domain